QSASPPMLQSSWHAAHARIEGASDMVTPGLQLEYLAEGRGRQPRAGDTVVVHYVGWLTDGQKFDSSLDRDEPFSFVLGRGQVIEGWEVGVAQMRVGDRVRLTI